ncbi:MinD/ParA family protein [Peribacillus sp. SCS-155]|uniref:MinD/ParA family protein n=1 Tax=Peribacillus sedimenti TaxID=3115297 RepID=UPI0039067A64
MMDQAQNLRIRLQQLGKPAAKTLAVVSGKGGVGKSNFSLNFSIALSKQGHSVLLFDMDIGMGNIDILMGRSSRYSIVDFFENRMDLGDIVSEGPEGISVIAGGSGLATLFEMEESRFSSFLDQLDTFIHQYEYIIFDMGAGITRESSQFILCVDELIVITTPEPPAIMDAYSVMKYLTSVKKDMPFSLVCNRVQSEKEGKETIQRLSNALQKFLQKEIFPLGFLPDDRSVTAAVTRQIPFSVYKPESAISKAINEVALRFEKGQKEQNLTFSKSNFLGRLKSYILGR